jgi:hypothetical protein
MDAQLRDLFMAAVGDPPRRLTVEAVRRRVIRRRRAEWVTGTAAVVLLTGLGIVVPGQLLFRSASTGGGGNSAPAGAPRYYLQTVATQPEPGQQVTLVRATATGAVTARVRCPWPNSYVANNGLAPADGRTFFVACQRSHGTRHFVVTGTRVYRFQLTGSGRIPGYTLVPGGNLGAVEVNRMAATRDGAQLAATAAPGNGTHRSSIEVINTQTGARAVWHNGSGAPGTIQFGIGDLSWTRAGRELVFQARVCTPGGSQCATKGQWRVIRHAAAGGELDNSKLLLLMSSLTGHAQGYINDSVITPDGSALIVVALHSPRGAGTPGNIDVVKVDPATGQPIRVLFQENTGNGVSYRSFAADPSTRFLILNAGPPQGVMHNGWIDNGKLVPLKPANGGNVVFEAW